MGSKYTSQSAAGYNSSPPPDDGTKTEANRVTWLKTKTKLTDPLKGLAESINSQLVTFTDFSGATVSANYDTVSSDHMKTLEASGTLTVNLVDAATVGAGYIVAIKNVGTGLVTTALKTVANTLDGVANGTTIVAPGAWREFKVKAGANGYISVDGHGDIAANVSSASAGRLQFVDATHVALMPRNGNRITIDGVQYIIPSTGVICLSTSTFIGGVTAQAVVANTIYDVYVFNNAGTLAIDLIAGGASHSTDANNGVEIKTGDSSRTLVGMVRTNASSQFTLAFVLSWANRGPDLIFNGTQGNTLAISWGPVEIQSANRQNFICWAGQSVSLFASGTLDSSIGGTSGQVSYSISVDSAVAEPNVVGDFAIPSGTPATRIVCAGHKTNMTEGLHYATLTWTSTLGGIGAGATASVSFNGIVHQ